MSDRLTSTLQILTDANELLAAHAALILRVRSGQQIHRLELKELDSPPQELLKLPLIHTSPTTPLPEPTEEKEQEEEGEGEVVSLLEDNSVQQQRKTVLRHDLTVVKRARAARYVNYVPEEETIRNDYSRRYVDSGEWPQNWVLGAEPDRRFEEYPKQKRLLELKKSSVNQYALPPTYLPYSELLSVQPSKFDVILLDPPFSSAFTWDHLQELPIPSFASDPSYIFLWIGSGAGEGLERGREVLARWGYRRCEDVVWIKTNKGTNQGPGTDPPTTSIFTRTKQHCLMGIRGTVRRSTDSWFVHCNVDTDVIIWEGDPSDPTRKPPETYTLIENFCLGMRRLEIFGRLSSLRRGWVTVFGPGQEEFLLNAADRNGDVTVDTIGEDGGETRMVARRWVQGTWEEGIKSLAGGNRLVVPMTSEIETLRPKSPVRTGQTVAAIGGTGQGVGSMPVPMKMKMNNAVGRFNNGGVPVMAAAQNQMMMAPMMGMNMNMNMGPMGMGMEEMTMMGNWNPMMAAHMNMNRAGMMGIPMMNQMGHLGMFGNEMNGWDGMGPSWPNF